MTRTRKAISSLLALLLTACFALSTIVVTLAEEAFVDQLVYMVQLLVGDADPTTVTGTYAIIPDKEGNPLPHDEKGAEKTLFVITGNTYEKAWFTFTEPGIYQYTGGKLKDPKKAEISANDFEEGTKDFPLTHVFGFKVDRNADGSLTVIPYTCEDNQAVFFKDGRGMTLWNYVFANRPEEPTTKCEGCTCKQDDGCNCGKSDNCNCGKSDGCNCNNNNNNNNNNENNNNNSNNNSQNQNQDSNNSNNNSQNQNQDSNNSNNNSNNNQGGNNSQNQDSNNNNSNNNSNGDNSNNNDINIVINNGGDNNGGDNNGKTDPAPTGNNSNSNSSSNTKSTSDTSSSTNSKDSSSSSSSTRSTSYRSSSTQSTSIKPVTNRNYEPVTNSNGTLKTTIVYANNSRATPASNSRASGVNTGDESQLILWVAVLGVAALGLIILVVVKRNRDDDEDNL